MQRPDDHNYAAAEPAALTTRDMNLTFNAFALIVQMILLGIMIVAFIPQLHPKSADGVWSLAGSLSGVLIYLTAPVTLLTALLGLRKHMGADRPPGQRRKVPMIDLFELFVSIVFLLPSVPIIASMMIYR
ncbi:MAG: hypothetical protein ACP5O1_06860 [Phycisphaerae bacterium]